VREKRLEKKEAAQGASRFFTRCQGGALSFNCFGEGALAASLPFASAALRLVRFPSF
jgi:hypothetical protein